MSITELPNPPLQNTYRPKPIVRLFAAVYLILATGYSFPLGRHVIVGSASSKMLELAGYSLFLLAGLALFIHAFTLSIRFTSSAIEKRSLFGNSEMPLDSILGRKIHRRDGGDGDTIYLVLVPRPENLPLMELPQDYDFDEKFHYWFQSLPDLGEDRD